MSDAKEKILFIVEGEKTERQIINNLQKNFLSDSDVEVVLYKQNIYELYSEIKNDEFLDVGKLVKEKQQNKLKTSNISDYTRDNFAEIYLFFDYDGHDSKADDKTIKAMLKLFDNETENGKLLISYPMVEAIKHITTNFENLTIKCSSNYKKKVNDCSVIKSLEKLQGFDFTFEQWKTITTKHLKKMSFIVYGDFKFPEDIISQDDIFENQLEKHIKPNQEVAVLSAFPAWLLDHYGSQRLKEKL